MILYYHDGAPYCRKCILEAEPGARFDDDDPTDWEYDPEGEPGGKLYYATLGGETVCRNELDEGCLGND